MKRHYETASTTEIELALCRADEHCFPQRPNRALLPLEISLRGASKAKAVGTTQLHVPGSHGQPNLSGSKRTRVSVVRNFHFQIQLASRPLASRSQSAAWLAAFDVRAARTRQEAEMRHRDALQFALQRGSRSGRIAWQFARGYAGAAALTKKSRST